jgi:hypothetical protein
MKARYAKSPSESAKSKEYRVYQRNSPIFDGRYDVKNPVETTAPPIQLFHPVFGHFLDDLSRDLPVPPGIAKATIGYMRAASAIYDNEANRRHALEPYLHRILTLTMSTVLNADRTSPDGMFLISLSGDIYETVMALLREDKNEFGDGGCDPSTQAGLSTVRFWVQDAVDKCQFSLSFCPF